MSVLVKQVNYDILGAFMQALEGSAYIDNIPELTRENVAEVGNAIMNYQPTRDLFYNSFIVKIKLQLFENMVGNNKFSFLKGQITDGIIEDAYVDYVKGEVFDGEDENPYNIKKASVKTLYHRVDRKLLYQTTIQDVQIRDAFNTPAGLSDLISRILDTLYQSKEWDEFTMTKQLLVDNYDKGKKINLTGTDKAQVVNDLLYQVKKYSQRLTFNSRDYNHLQVVNASSYDNQIIVMHQDYKLDIDMGVLANTMNVDKVKLESRMIVVDNFNDGIKTEDETETKRNIVAVIFDKRGIRLHDSLVHMETQRNAKALYTNYFLHVWQIMSYAFFHNLIYFIEPDAPLGSE